MKIDYNNKTFRLVHSSKNGELTNETIFRYKQKGNILTSSYSCASIRQGQLLGLVDEKGNIEIHYHQINNRNIINTGICHSKPEILPSGKIRLHEQWKWTSGDQSIGKSILEEIRE
ncbi:n-acetylglutamate synthase [Flagellimonas meishanensis]|uniref:n-acetylglutamate synthase n=1 Tax=Flagellimonas meishanensis TaxID=2873264 RepID=UPI00223B39B5|nr:n-acetylglutamate synthase [[Muricauda] meishanensis]